LVHRTHLLNVHSYSAIYSTMFNCHQLLQ